MDTVNREDPNPTSELAMPEDTRIALVMQAELEGQHGYAVHAMDGTPLGWFEQLDVAFAAARQHNLIPVNVH